MHERETKNNRVLRITRRTLLALAVLLVGVLLVDYFSPAELQVDLNAPRFRLVRHRMILPDQEFGMEWAPATEWSESPSESPPIFGERTRGGVYAWECYGYSRFESLYDESGGGTNDVWIRTNYGSYQMSTRQLPPSLGVFLTRAEWANRYPHGQSAFMSQEEIAALEMAKSNRLPHFQTIGTTSRLQQSGEEQKSGAKTNASFPRHKNVGLKAAREQGSIAKP
jgi:hypothetical protein